MSLSWDCSVLIFLIMPCMRKPTYKKHMGRKEKNAGFHQSPDVDPKRAMNEMNAQNAAGIYAEIIVRFDLKL